MMLKKAPLATFIHLSSIASQDIWSWQMLDSDILLILGKIHHIHHATNPIILPTLQLLLDYPRKLFNC